MEVFGKQTNIDFLGKRKIAAVFSALLITAGVGSLLTRGLNLGIDFTGGVLVEVAYEDAADLPDIRARLTQGGFDNALVQSFGSANDVLIRVLPEEAGDAPQGDSAQDESGKDNPGEDDAAEDEKSPADDASERNKSAAVGSQIEKLLAAGGTKLDLRRTEFVGPQVGQELTERGGLAMLFAVIMILIYIMIRFQWKFAVGSVAALVHDVLVTIGLFSIFQFPFDLSVLAAILAVIGYSLNDTIVVFDRIRENFRLIRTEGAEAIMNISINQMLGRTVITSLTTMLVLLALFFLGGEAVRGFSLALIIGIVIGTYSSIYIASASALALDVTTEDLLPPKVDKEAIDDLP